MNAFYLAMLNLGIALMKLERNSEALVQFEEVLQRSPPNALALSNAEILRSKLHSGQTPQ